MIFVSALVALGVEIAAFVAVADRIGVLWALLVLFGVSAMGPFIVKRVGIGVLAHTQERLAKGELPTGELLDGIVVLIGGALITVPGFVGDAIGLALMVGPLRHAVIRRGGHRLARRVERFPAPGASVVDVRSWTPDGKAASDILPRPQPEPGGPASGQADPGQPEPGGPGSGAPGSGAPGSAPPSWC